MANEDKIVFPNGRRLNEFALSGSSTGTITGSGVINTITKWTSTNVIGNAANVYEAGDDLILTRYSELNMNQNDMIGVQNIYGASGVTILRVYQDPGTVISALSIMGGENGDVHFGESSGFIRDNNGTVELHLLSGKKFSVIWG